MAYKYRMKKTPKQLADLKAIADALDKGELISHPLTPAEQAKLDRIRAGPLGKGQPTIYGGLAPAADRIAELASRIDLEQSVDPLRTRGRPKIGEGSKRVSVSIELGLLADADTLAAAQGWTRSSMIARALRRLLTHWTYPEGTLTGQPPENTDTDSLGIGVVDGHLG